MSCCGGSCGCGSSCQCNSGCTGCKMYPGLAEEKFNATETAVLGVAPIRGGIEGFEMGVASENDCKCGPKCNCKPCLCNE